MSKRNSKVFVLDGSRTPIGSFGRGLRSVEVDQLAKHSMVNAIRRAGINPGQLDGIVLGHGYQSSYTPNTARVAALLANIPASVPAKTIQRQCGSGMESVNEASEKILVGNADLMLVGGAESMSTIPYMLPGAWRWKGFIANKFKIVKMGPRPILFGLLDNGLAPMKLLKDTKTVYMAGTAQRLSDTYGISREASDEYALRSQILAAQAIESGRFAEEIDPILVPGRGFMTNDEHPRKTSAEKLAALKGVLGTRDITAGNSSGINDGACMLVIASDRKVEELGKEPLVELVDSSVVGVDPDQMGLGPVAAINKLLDKTGMTLDDIDLIEINEAFSAQYLACEKLLGLDREKVNVNGGAIALGHPIGMTGARLILTLGYELKRRGLKRGIAALCIGGGMGIATMVERP